MTAKQPNIHIPEKKCCGISRFIHVPLCRQETGYTCGAACVQSILGHYGIDYRQDQLAKKLHSKPDLGTHHEDIINFVQKLGFQASFVNNMAIKDIKSLINQGITPMLLIQAWADEGTDYAANWEESHYVIACGYDGNMIFFMDPWTLGNYTYLPSPHLLERWHALDSRKEQHHNSGLIITKEHGSCKYDPSIVRYLE